MRTYRILSLGAGVQSTTIALMVKRGEIDPIDAAIFADTQEESGDTYKHLEWLISETKDSFPTHVVSRGKLGDDLVSGTGASRRSASIPSFQSEKEGEKCSGITPRQCTMDYKVAIVEKTIRQTIVGLKPRQRFPKDMSVVQLIGLSFDEPSRVLRVRNQFEKLSWSKCEFPIFQKQMTRSACLLWLRKYGVPHEVPRSACVFCPYKSNVEWQRLKQSDSSGWSRALEIDKALRDKSSACARDLRSVLWLHRSCVPLEQVDFRSADERVGQTIISFDTECTGMCGN